MISCTVNKDQATAQTSDNKTKIETNTSTVTLQIIANDLSEDLSPLSTKNDEVFALVYNFSDTNTLVKPLVQVKLLFDDTTRV